MVNNRQYLLALEVKKGNLTVDEAIHLEKSTENLDDKKFAERTEKFIQNKKAVEKVIFIAEKVAEKKLSEYQGAPETKRYMTIDQGRKLQSKIINEANKLLKGVDYLTPKQLENKLGQFESKLEQALQGLPEQIKAGIENQDTLRTIRRSLSDSIKDHMKIELAKAERHLQGGVKMQMDNLKEKTDAAKYAAERSGKDIGDKVLEVVKEGRVIPQTPEKQREPSIPSKRSIPNAFEKILEATRNYRSKRHKKTTPKETRETIHSRHYHIPKKLIYAGIALLATLRSETTKTKDALPRHEDQYIGEQHDKGEWKRYGFGIRGVAIPIPFTEHFYGIHTHKGRFLPGSKYWEDRVLENPWYPNQRKITSTKITSQPQEPSMKLGWKARRRIIRNRNK